MKEEIEKLKLEIKRLELMLRLKEESPPIYNGTPVLPTPLLPTPLHYHNSSPCWNTPCVYC